MFIYKVSNLFIVYQTSSQMIQLSTRRSVDMQQATARCPPALWDALSIYIHPMDIPAMLSINIISCSQTRRNQHRCKWWLSGLYSVVKHKRKVKDLKLKVKLCTRIMATELAREAITSDENPASQTVRTDTNKYCCSNPICSRSAL